MPQKNIFTEYEGDRWYDRNKVTPDNIIKKKTSDPLLNILFGEELSFGKVLEIGASNGWRLAALKEVYPDISMYGIEPSEAAVREAYRGIEIRQGTADMLPYENNSFDLVIFGFCLYLCDREDLFKIAAEADRVLKDGGYMAIYDFYAEQPYVKAYKHVNGMHSYKMDYSRLFQWNPSYSLVKKHVQPHPGYEDQDTRDNRVAVHVLKKDKNNGWPNNIS